MKYLLLIIYIIFTTGGITFMKLGGDSLKIGFNNKCLLSMSWQTFLGFLLYIVSFLLWQRLVVKYDLSIMVPIVTGIVQIIILFIGYFIFKESFNMITLIGALLIIIGIIVMAIGAK